MNVLFFYSKFVYLTTKIQNKLVICKNNRKKLLKLKVFFVISQSETKNHQLKANNHYGINRKNHCRVTGK